jgi:hypothetical protein
MSFTFMVRPAEASAAVNECATVLPHDPEQWIRVARIHAIISMQPNSEKYADDAIVALRQAIKYGYRDVEVLRGSPNLKPLHQRADFVELMADLERRVANADRQ